MGEIVLVHLQWKYYKPTEAKGPRTEIFIVETNFPSFLST